MQLNASEPVTLRKASLSSLGAALPTATPKVSKDEKSELPSPAPPCFADVERLRTSKLPAHQKIVAALDGIRAALPMVGGFSPASYLAVILVSLERLVRNARVNVELDVKHDESGKIKTGIEIVEGVRHSRRIKKKMLNKDVDKGAGLLDHGKCTNKGSNLVPARPGDAELIVVFVHLMGLAVRGCPKSVVNARAGSLLDVLSDAYLRSREDHALTRQIPRTLSNILAVLGPTGWKLRQPYRAYYHLLSLATSSEDAKTRRKARAALVALNKASSAPLIALQTSKMTVDLFSKRLSAVSQNEEGIAKRVSNRKSSNYEDIVHVILAASVVQSTLRGIDAARLALELADFVRCSQSASTPMPHHISVLALKVLSMVFEPSNLLANDRTDAKESPSDNNLLNLGMSRMSRQKLLELLAAIGSGMEEMRLRIEGSSSEGNSELIVEYCMTYARCAAAWCSQRGRSLREVPIVVERLIKWIDLGSEIRRDIVPGVTKALNAVLERTNLVMVSGVLVKLQVLLDLKFAGIWDRCLWMIRRFLEHTGEESGMKDSASPAIGNEVKREMRTFILTVVLARKSASDRGDQKSCRLLEGVCAAALRGGAAEVLLDVAGFGRFIENRGIRGFEVREGDILTEWTKDDWLLPLVRDHTKISNLNVYLRRLLPLVNKTESMSALSINEGRVIAGKIWSNVANLVSSCLPAFCRDPRDLGDAATVNAVFDCVSQWIDGSNAERADFGIAVLRSLAVSVLRLDEQDPGTIKKQALFCKGFRRLYPKVFALATRMDFSKRERLLDCLTKAAGATSNSVLVAECLKYAVSQLLRASVATDSEVDYETIKHVAADVAISLAESGVVCKKSAELDYFQRAMMPLLKDGNDHVLQKKAYRAMALLIASNTMALGEESLLKFIDLLCDAQTRSKVATGAKAARLSLIQAVIEAENNPMLDAGALPKCTHAFLPEIIINTRESSEKTRQSAFCALVALARAYNIAGEGQRGLCKFLSILAATFAGKSSAIISATLSSLGRIIHEFRSEAMANENLAKTVDSFFVRTTSKENGDVDKLTAEPGIVGIMLQHRIHEVQKAALGLVKLATSSLGAVRLAKVLPGIISGLVSVAASSKKHETRLRVKVVLERLLRKCGREELEKVFPKDHLRLLASVRKQYSRDLLKKHVKRHDADRKDQTKTEHGKRKHDMGDVQYEGNIGDNESLDEHDTSDLDVEAELVDGPNIVDMKRYQGEIVDFRMRENPNEVLNLLDRTDATDFTSAVADDRKDKECALNCLKRAQRDFEIAEDGRPIFVESDTDSDVAAECGSVENDNDQAGEQATKGSDSRIRKRRRNGLREERTLKKLQGSFGEEFRSIKAEGDVKRPGRPDPYAYVPLGRGMSTLKLAKREKSSKKTKRVAKAKGKRKLVKKRRSEL